MQTWHWQTWQDRPYLTCSLLQSWSHGFFTQSCWPHPPEALTTALHPTATVHRVRQVHGDTVLEASRAQVPVVSAEAEDTPPERPPADALLSDGPRQSVWVCSADCNPVLIGDVKTGQVAAIHAGWRGTALKIVPAAVAKFQAQGSDLADLRVAMGPAIAGPVYQVSTQVACEVGRTLAPAAAEDCLIEALQDQENSPILPDSEPGRVRLDVRRVNQLQLLQLGLEAAQIAIAPHCTYQEPDRFFSYRRTKEKKVQWSGIVSRE